MKKETRELKEKRDEQEILGFQVKKKEERAWDFEFHLLVIIFH